MGTYHSLNPKNGCSYCRFPLQHQSAPHPYAIVYCHKGNLTAKETGWNVNSHQINRKSIKSNKNLPFSKLVVFQFVDKMRDMIVWLRDVGQRAKMRDCEIWDI
jgi:hypothetical protein